MNFTWSRNFMISRVWIVSKQSWDSSWLSPTLVSSQVCCCKALSHTWSHCIPQIPTFLYNTAPHCIPQITTLLYNTAPQCTTLLGYIEAQGCRLHHITVNCTPLQYSSQHYSKLHHTTLYCTTLQNTAPHYSITHHNIVTLQYTVLHYYILH